MIYITDGVTHNSIRFRKGTLLTTYSLLVGHIEELGIYKGNSVVLVKKIDGINIINLYKKLKENE